MVRCKHLVGFALVLGIGLPFGMGCSDPDPQPFHLQLISIDAHGGPALSEDRVQSILRRSLEGSPSFSPAERDQRSGARGHALIAALEYRELPDTTKRGRDLMVRLHVESPKELAERLGDAGLDVTVLVEIEGQTELAADLQRATDRLAAILQARVDLALGSEGAVERLLRSSDPDRLLLTLEWLRDHGEQPQARVAAAVVAPLINHPDDRVGLLAIETIGQIGGPEHVSLVLERIRLADGTQVSHAYDAIARLGGPDAAGFLEFAARNEDEPGRRAAAQRALRRVADSDRVELPRRSDRSPTRGHR